MFGYDGLDTIQVVLVVLLSILIANYIYLRWSLRVNREAELGDIESFANPEGPDGDTIVLGNELLYDEFYAKIYDQIVDGSVRQDAETNLTLAWAKTYRPEMKTLEVLDIGCGTGGNVKIFKDAGVGKVVGLDASDAMIAVARKKHPKLDFRVGSAEQIGLFSAGEFNLMTLFYFTFYYLSDFDGFFKNAFNWLQPGGCLVIHLVNREKFDPILESANPFVAFSPQKYTKERITKSKVSFDKFNYTAEFLLNGETATFREDFRFKNGKKRHQRHTMRMPKMESVVSMAESNGFVYKQFIELTAIGYEYQYLFCFVR